METKRPRSRSRSRDRIHNSSYRRKSDNVWGNADKEEAFEKSLNNNTLPEEEKAKANFALTGALAKDERTGNMVNGVVLKWNEPLDAAMPDIKWRLYVFKEDQVVDMLHIHRKSAYLFGRDERIADVILQHPSCSKQHAVIQFRSVKKGPKIESRDDSQRIVIRPYIMDLGSAHKTMLNGAAIEDARYYELLEKDCIKFGGSSREYVLLHDQSA